MHTTLLFLLRENEILLAMKKRGFGAGRWNGMGGKIEPNETIEAATARECREEIGISPGQLEKVAHLTFMFPDGMTDILAHVYITREWEGKPIETEEMAPQWFALGDIPYHKMWQDDEHWLPHILDGKKLVATFMFTADEQMLPDKSKITFVDEVPNAV
jgi:mutator protein MutT